MAQMAYGAAGRMLQGFAWAQLGSTLQTLNRLRPSSQLQLPQSLIGLACRLQGRYTETR